MNFDIGQTVQVVVQESHFFGETGPVVAIQSVPHAQTGQTIVYYTVTLSIGDVPFNDSE